MPDPKTTAIPPPRAELERENAALRERVRRLEERLSAQAAPGSPQAAGSGPGQPCSGDEERRYRCIVDTADEGIWAIDSSHQTSFVNQKLAQMLGYEPGEMVGQPVEQFLFPEDMDDHAQRMVQRRQGQKQRYQRRLRRKDGGALWASVSATPMLDAKGEFAGSFAMYTDITQARALEDELARSRQRFKAMFENALDGILVYDDGARLMEANPAACRLSGYLPAELTGLMIWDLIPEESRGQRRHSWQRFTQQGRLSGETTLLTRDGRQVEVEFQAVANILPGLHMSLLRDIRQRKRAQAEHQRNEARLQSLLRISQYKAASEQELLDYSLREALDLTASKIGYIYLYDQQKRTLTLNSWSREVMRECEVASPQTVYQLDQTGFWGEVVRQGRPVVLNDFASPHPLKKGYPPGHVALTRFCSVPIWGEDGIVALAGVANKETDYGEGDILQLTLLMDAVWKILERQRAIKGLKESEQRFQSLVENAPDAIFIQTQECFAYLNQAALRLFGAHSLAQMLGRPVVSFFDPEDRQQVLERIRALNQEKKPAPMAELRCLRLDGAPVEVEVSAVPFRYQDQDGALSFARDISARKQAESALRQSEEKFRLAFKTNPDSININRLHDGLYLDVNDGFLAMTGYTREEVLGKSSLELDIWVDPADRARLVKGLRQEGKVANLEAKFRFKDGRVVTGLMSAVVIDWEGQPCILSISRDIEEFKKAQAELRQWADAFQNCALGMSLGNPADDTLLACNPALARMVGRSVEEIVGQSVLVLYDPRDHQEIKRQIELVQRQGQSQFETRIIRADGSLFPAQVDLVRVRDAEGRPRYRVATIQDITESKKAREALRLSEEKFSKAFKASPMWFSVTTAEEGRFLEVNDTFSNLTGFSREETLGHTSFDLNLWLDPEHDRQRALELYRREGRFYNLEVPMRFKDGQVHTMLWSMEPMELAGQACFINALVDITEQKKAETEKARLEAQLRQAQKMEAIGTLAGGIAHDFNNILGAIIGYAELAQEMAQEGEDNLSELAQVLRAADRARNLVRQILTFSRKAEADLQPLNLNQSVRQSLEMLERSLPKMIAIETQLEPYLHMINADPNQMEQVLLNLATNAADAMPEGGRLIIETQNLALDQEDSPQDLELRPGPYVLLLVSDTGQGIEEALLEHIFDPFFTTKGVGKGTGLGLSTVYGIVKGHGGHLACHSQTGQGTTFKVYLPAFSQALPHPPQEQGPPAPQLKGGETILLVDDELALRNLGSRTLAGMGYRVLTASSGEEALDLWKSLEKRPDLVVLDLGMPGMGGHKCLERILALDPGAKVVIASGYAANDQVKASLEAGGAGFVAKPFRRIDLLTTVRNILNSK